ncbi:DUF2510 domain-containing protein [Kitasatospora atroaurantiaca]|uniref:Uncharacterized protein DUF2510 n=1 Tax=Kitasatospora atroaurantiaca TaxID=285545 RepID=A0A561EZ35_9ACTN|nr:DUF2510 domain-containing protein [Kitasatospora atroaurantiaca]TWE20878.1 uncharacterized protein DUF2510 [Kitasatospora atroaurantiaca]
MSEQIPAGWYPDPQDTTSDPRPQRWWDGKGWTASTRPAPGDGPAPAPEAGNGGTADTKVLEGEVLQSGPAVRFPELPTVGTEPGAAPAARRKLPKPVVIAATIAALAGLAVGSGVTYLAMDGRSDTKSARQGDGRPGYRFGGDGFGGQGGPGGNGGGSNDGSNGGSGGGTATDGVAVDVVNRISLPFPSGWSGGTTGSGFAALAVGSYSCPGGSGECSLGGVVTGRLKGTDAKQAAQQDIAAAAKESYGDIKSHEELKSEAVTVNGRSGYLVRWKVDAPQGNDGYVESVVFPTANGKSLVSVRLGFDIDAKAPKVDQMDDIVKSITDYTGKGLGGASGGTKA